MNNCHMESTRKVEIAKQAIKEMMEEEEDQATHCKPTAKDLLFRLFSLLDSLQEEDVGKLCPEMDETEENPVEQWDSLQEEDIGKLFQEVDEKEEKPKEPWDSLQEEGVQKSSPKVDKTGEKPKKHLDPLQEGSVEKSCSEVGKTGEKSKKQLDSSQEVNVEELVCPIVDKTEEIIKEVRNMKRQNLITHCLVSTMILVTAAWQISEMAMLLKVKDGLSNPFSFLGGIVKSSILNNGARSEGDGEQSSANQKPPLIKLPDLPFLDFPMFDSTDEE